MSEYSAELTEVLLTADEDEPHIVIAEDRTVHVPDELKCIAVQFDHNIETVTFDCPRYWDEHDFSTMHIFVNYRCADGNESFFPCGTPTIDPEDENIIHFNWLLSRNVTCAAGVISFVVCVKRSDDEGVLENQWHSRLNQEMKILDGLECPTEEVVTENPDVIEYILARLGGDPAGGYVGQDKYVSDYRFVNGFNDNSNTLVLIFSDGSEMSIEMPKNTTYTDIDSFIRWGETDPTTETFGEYKQLYVNTATGKMWVCMNAKNTFMSTNEWLRVFADDEIFIAENEFTSFADIYSAHLHGKLLMARNGNKIYQLCTLTNSAISFCAVDESSIRVLTVTSDNDWNETTNGFQGAGTENVFIAEHSVTSFADIISESAAGKLVFAMRRNVGLFLPLAARNSSVAAFRGMDGKKITQWTVTPDNVWVSETIGTVETTSNKTTVIDEESTDTQYPSAKAVYDFVTENAGGGGVVENASGELLVLPDAIDSPILGLAVYGKSTQNGTPSSGVPVPIVSAFDNADSVNIAGKNLLRGAPVTYSSNGLLGKLNTDGSVTVSGKVASTGTALMYFFNSSYAGDYKKIWLRPGMQYSYSVYKDGVKYAGKTSIRFKDKDGTALYNLTKDSYVDAIYTQLTLDAGDTSLCGTYWIQFEFNKTATAYEPYMGCQSLPVTTPLCGVPVTSGGNYTDSSGQQWVCDEIDFGRGVKVQRTKRVRFSGASGEIWERQNSSSPYVFMETGLTNDNKLPVSNDDTAQILCDKFNPTKYSGINTASVVDVISASNAQAGIYVKASGFTGSTAQDFTTWLASNPFEVVYILDAPIETLLSDEELAAYAELHTNYPITTIYADGNAGLSVAYVVDTKTYIDKAQTLNYIETKTIKVGDNVLSDAAVTLGAGWTESGGVYTHATGNDADLTFETAVEEGAIYILEFDTSYTANEFVRVGIGDRYRVLCYQDKSHITVPLMASGGTTLYITPISTTYTGSISNITLRKIQESGTELDLEIYSTTTDNHTKNYGFWNTFIGKNVAENAVGTTRSIGIGYYTLNALQGGHRNIGIGTFAMSQMIGGEQNVAIGSDSMLAAKKAESCVSIGFAAMYYGKSHTNDVAIGLNAMRGVAASETSGNIAIGNQAGFKVTNAQSNIFIGNNSGYNVTSGASNTIIGDGAAKALTTGRTNTVVGRNAAVPATARETVVIGDGATATKDYQTVIGSDNITETLVKGNLVVRGTDGVMRQIVFNADGTCSWTEVT